MPGRAGSTAAARAPARAAASRRARAACRRRTPAPAARTRWPSARRLRAARREAGGRAVGHSTIVTCTVDARDRGHIVGVDRMNSQLMAPRKSERLRRPCPIQDARSRSSSACKDHGRSATPTLRADDRIRGGAVFEDRRPGRRARRAAAGAGAPRLGRHAGRAALPRERCRRAGRPVRADDWRRQRRRRHLRGAARIAPARCSSTTRRCSTATTCTAPRTATTPTTRGGSACWSARRSSCQPPAAAGRPSCTRTTGRRGWRRST